jgi:hypothetical protein
MRCGIGVRLVVLAVLAFLLGLSGVARSQGFCEVAVQGNCRDGWSIHVTGEGDSAPCNCPPIQSTGRPGPPASPDPRLRPPQNGL